jgi:hypothetical protein
VEECCVTTKAKLNIRRLKDFAITKIPKNWVLREILIAETTELEVSTFLARLPIWLQLSALKRGDHK